MKIWIVYLESEARNLKAFLDERGAAQFCYDRTEQVRKMHGDQQADVEFSDLCYEEIELVGVCGVSIS